MSDPGKYLIVGGSTKCGTTSVFSYFQFHPQVCPCVMKESRYFLESDYLFSAGRKNTPEVDSFSKLFSGCTDSQLRFEATPDYLYSQIAIDRIGAELEQVKLVFILRDPVDRLISWYKFASLNGMIPKEVSFDEFISMQSFESTAPQHLRAMKQGCYSKYLRAFISRFGKERIHVCFYETLKTDPQNLCSGIASFAGIDTNYFEGYRFEVFNPSVPVKSVMMHRLMRQFKRSVRPLTRLFPDKVREKLKFAGRKAENLYIAANKDTDGTEVVIGNDTIHHLRKLYKNEPAEIAQLTGRQPDWNYLQ